MAKNPAGRDLNYCAGQSNKVKHSVGVRGAIEEALQSLAETVPIKHRMGE